jgi:two-component system sensor histidine kinase KdpD
VSISIDRAQALDEVTRGEAAKESERLRTLMIDSVTHELRTPLTSIKAAATALLSSTSISSEDRTELLTVIDEESDRLNRLVSEAVEMNQLDTQEVHMTFAPASVDELVHAALESCASALSTHQVELKLLSLPRVNVDREYIEKVLCNLLENAAKYSTPGSPIFVSAEPQPRNQPDLVAISIADRGMGIEEAEQSLIFDRFYRARGNGFQTSGTGMGLAISRAILEAHRGSISVTSQPGLGSVFTFTLPVLQSRA